MAKRITVLVGDSDFKDHEFVEAMDLCVKLGDGTIIHIDTRETRPGSIELRSEGRELFIRPSASNAVFIGSEGEE